MKKKKKYAFGNYVTNPSQDLAENNIALAKAMKEASSNPWVQGLNIFGGLAQTVGSSMMNSKGASTTTLGGDAASTTGFGGDINSFFSSNKDNASSGVNLIGMLSQMFAMGGTVGDTNSEVEGKEVAKLPDGNTIQFEGPSHEAGGIDINLPEGTEVFSKRIKIDGVSLATRKKGREKRQMTLEELVGADPTDIVIANSLKRTIQVNEKENAMDMDIQKVVNNKLATPGTKKMAFGSPGPTGSGNPILDLILQGMNGMQDNQYGGWGGNTGFGNNGNPTEIEGVTIQAPKRGGINTKLNDVILQNPTISDPGIDSKVPLSATPTATGEGFDFSNILGGLTTGDALGMVGNYISTFGPMQNTRENRAGDTPNVNSFLDYGQDSLNTIDSMKGYINQVRDEALGDIQLGRNSSVMRNRNSARSVNTQRALDFATDAQANEANENTYNQFAQSMLNILGQQAQMEANRDQVVMTGEQNRDLADRQDRDNYYSQMAEDIATKGYGLQETGKDVNAVKTRQVIENLINQLSRYGITMDSNGNLVTKAVPEIDGATRTPESVSAMKTNMKDVVLPELQIMYPDIDFSKLSVPNIKPKKTIKKRK